MKNIILLLASFVFTVNCYSQTNLVNNGSFETYSTCPSAFSQIEYATGWKKSYFNNANSGGWHTEYVNSCNGGNWVGVPANGWGSENAFDGNGYICLAPTAQMFQANYRENVYTQLNSPLSVGAMYRVSFRVSLGDVCRYASDHLCARFGTDTIFPINNQAQCVSGLISSNNGWTLVSQTFVADSAYQYLCIGNFFTDANMQFTLAYPNNSNQNSTYYIDSVQVVQIPGKDDILEMDGDFIISLNPNPAHDQITISGLTQGTEGTVEMYTSDGRMVFSWQVNVSSTPFITLNLPAECARGIYFIRFVGEEVSRAEKILIE